MVKGRFLKKVFEHLAWRTTPWNLPICAPINHFPDFSLRRGTGQSLLKLYYHRQLTVLTRECCPDGGSQGAELRSFSSLCPHRTWHAAGAQDELTEGRTRKRILNSLPLALTSNWWPFNISNLLSPPPLLSPYSGFISWVDKEIYCLPVPRSSQSCLQALIHPAQGSQGDPSKTLPLTTPPRVPAAIA